MSLAERGEHGPVGPGLARPGVRPAQIGHPVPIMSAP
jgi:hypothetical protein